MPCWSTGLDSIGILHYGAGSSGTLALGIAGAHLAILFEKNGFFENLFLMLRIFGIYRSLAEKSSFSVLTY